MYTLGEKIVPRDIEAEIKDSYLSYAMSVIVGRALPDVRDGLKPVHRRILYAMMELGLEHTKAYKKSARIVGDCLGRYHPHGDTAVYDALVRLAQDFSMRYPLVDGQGNFGCFTGDTKIRLVDGTVKSFEELAQLPPETPFYVYAVDRESHCIVVAPGRHARITRRAAELVEVALDNGAKIRCTPDHRFLLRNGAYKEAKDLTPDDSLRAGYFDSAPVREERSNDYLRIQQPDGTWTFVHWLADEYNIERGRYLRSAGRIRHHQDFNRLNNAPDNIERLSFREHNRKHAEHAKELWREPAFRAKQRAGVQRYYAAHPEVLAARRERLVHANRTNAHRTPASEQRRIASLKLFSERHPERRAASARRLKLLWQDAAARSALLTALRAAVRRPLSAEAKARVAQILSVKSRKMWADPTQRRRIVQALRAVMRDPAIRAQLSASSKALWQDTAFRAKYAPGHHRAMAKTLWANPTTTERHRSKIAVQWQQPAFREAQRRGVEQSNTRRLQDNPNLMQQLARQAAASLTRRWQEPAHRRQVMRTRILTYLNHLRTEEGIERLTPETFDVLRPGNWVPRYEKAVRYFDAPQELLELAVVRNHRVVSVRPLQEHADVYDMTVDEHHNFLLDAGVFVHNSVDGDAAAAMRYTEAKLARIAQEMLADIEKETVEFMPNFDESMMEPKVLPARLPNLLINGSSGIAVGMATNIPPHNLSEVVDGIVALIDAPDITVKELAKRIKGPDFPTGALILGREGIKAVYETGRGSVKLRARAAVETQKSGRESIIVTEIPYQVNKANLIEATAGLVTDKKIEGISDIRDESDKDGMRIVIELKRDAVAQVILNQLYKHTSMETSFGVIMLALVDGRPKVLNLREMLVCYVEHRKDVVVRRTRYDLTKAQERAHILEGLKKALKNLDAVIKTIRQSKSPAEAKAALVKTFDFSERQAQAILEMQLQRLTALERDKLEAEYLELIKKIEYYQSILASEKKVLELIKAEVLELKQAYGDERLTEIVAATEELNIEDLIAEEDVVITISHAGYIKRLPVSAYRKQRRGGVGVTAMEMKEEDFVEHLFVASTHEYLMFFTNQGKAYWLKVHEIPQASRQAKGKAIANLLALQPGESLETFVAVKAFKAEQFLVMATAQGVVKKTPLEAYSNPRKAGIIAITLDKTDRLIEATITDGQQELLLLTQQGKAIRFAESQVREVGRSARGVKGVSLGGKDAVIGMEIVRKDATILTVTSLGFGKRSLIDEYRVQSRGGKGIINIKVTKKNGEVVGAKTVTDQDELMIISQEGMMVRCPVKDIRETGRNAQGVRLITLKGKDRVTSIARVAPKEETE